ncbi:hypothetical protein [Phenylobacterium sp.]|jgi:hypothetical protein|uniref:hypothetical protein n=1 Tax=Phenylobacterium sp. TaxID=1871053 RepID=UPI002F933F6D
MASSDSEASRTPDCSPEDEARRAADRLKGEIAALRAKVQSARARLSAQAEQPRSFED